MSHYVYMIYKTLPALNAIQIESYDEEANGLAKNKAREVDFP